MEFLSSLCSFIVTAIILIGIPVGVIWLIIAIVKKQSKKMSRNILLGCIAGIVVFSIIGGSAWSGTDDYTEYQAEKEEQESLQALADAEKEQKDNTSNNEPATQTEIETQTETEVETEVVETESEINVDELSEEEYKEMCQEIYDEEEISLEEKLQIGQFVKMDGSISLKYKYLQVAAFEDLRDRLQDKYCKAAVLHKDYSKPNLPVYGELIYLVFDKDSSLSVDVFESGQEVVIYGEVVKFWDGVYVMPRYMDVVER